jgi:hypothetical protein
MPAKPSFCRLFGSTHCLVRACVERYGEEEFLGKFDTISTLPQEDRKDECSPWSAGLRPDPADDEECGCGMPDGIDRSKLNVSTEAARRTGTQR